MTWEFMGATSWLAVELSELAEGTRLKLRHTQHTDNDFWTQFGPGATGVGWDLGAARARAPPRRGSGRGSGPGGGLVAVGGRPRLLHRVRGGLGPGRHRRPERTRRPPAPPVRPRVPSTVASRPSRPEDARPGCARRARQAPDPGGDRCRRGLRRCGRDHHRRRAGSVPTGHVAAPEDPAGERSGRRSARWARPVCTGSSGIGWRRRPPGSTSSRTPGSSRWTRWRPSWPAAGANARAPGHARAERPEGQVG